MVVVRLIVHLLVFVVQLVGVVVHLVKVSTNCSTTRSSCSKTCSQTRFTISALRQDRAIIPFEKLVSLILQSQFSSSENWFDQFLKLVKPVSKSQYLEHAISLFAK